MLKRSDLVKQFELTTKQEIINHQETINNLTKSINDLKRDVIENRKLADENYAKLQSLHKAQEIDLKNFQDRFNTFYQFFVSQNNDQHNINYCNSALIDEIGSAVKNQLNINEQFQESTKKIAFESSDIQKQCKDLYKLVLNIVEYNNAQVNASLEKTKEEIFSKPSESILLRKEFGEQIAAHAVDVEGLLKEIRVNQKAVYLIEKKLEQIYTLIDRLQKQQNRGLNEPSLNNRY